MGIHKLNTTSEKEQIASSNLAKFEKLPPFAKAKVRELDARLKKELGNYEGDTGCIVYIQNRFEWHVELSHKTIIHLRRKGFKVIIPMTSFAIGDTLDMDALVNRITDNTNANFM